MTAAYNYIYSSNIPTLNATHYYVRYKPSNMNDLNLLDSFDVEVYDYPLDRNIIQDGDYWPEAYNSGNQGEFPWLYTVVEKSFVMPGNIQRELLDSLFITDDNEALEDEAYYISGNSLCDSSYLVQREIIKKYYLNHPERIDPCIAVPDACGPGGGGSGGGGSHSTLKPKGMISFQTETISANIIGASSPHRYIRVVGKRFMKIDKTYTDANGNFQFSKRFPRKVTIVVKFKASVSHGQHLVRLNTINLGIWRSMFPIVSNP